jgi:hypothetical protein
MSTTERVQAAQVMSTTTTTGAKAPKAVLDAYQRATRISDTVHSIPAPQGAVAVAVAAALDRGDDPAADAGVMQALTANSLVGRGITDAVDDIAYAQFLEVCRDEADAIINAWSRPFTGAADTLTAAHQRIGDLPLQDSATILQKGGDVAHVWAQATSASEVIDTIRTGWVALAQFTRLATIDPRYPVLRMAAVSGAVWTERNLERQQLSPWEALIAGLDLSLPTFGEYRQRVAQLEADLQRAVVDAVPVDTQRSLIAGRPIKVLQ